jgi:hypothetical protein
MSLLQRIRQIFRDRLAAWEPPPPDLPEDPTADVRHPRWQGPGGRRSAVAVEEPDPDESVQVIGRLRTRGN